MLEAAPNRWCVVPTLLWPSRPQACCNFLDCRPILRKLRARVSAASASSIHSSSQATQPTLNPAGITILTHAGVQDVVAIEYRFTPLLAVLAPAGLKLLIVNPEVRRGMLLLQPENVVVLGGMVRGAASSFSNGLLFLQPIK